MGAYFPVLLRIGELEGDHICIIFPMSGKMLPGESLSEIQEQKCPGSFIWVLFSTPDSLAGPFSPALQGVRTGAAISREAAQPLHFPDELGPAPPYMARFLLPHLFFTGSAFDPESPFPSFSHFLASMLSLISEIPELP